ncbi:hypothetical protein GCM10023213_48370 [Prosthecobacter algae]|uniref:Uncharacterized protein n=1 Tax=Prosthecobacter algae TaxID=1144682 RepID=A0ABP9PPI9_9BACT
MKWIVAERRWKGQRQFYIIPKEAVTHDNGIDYYVGKPEGPLSPEAYEKEAVKRSLPSFSWHSA